MAVADDRPSDSDPSLESREPTLEDLRDLCRALNERGARYVLIQGDWDARFQTARSAVDALLAGRDQVR